MHGFFTAGIRVEQQIGWKRADLCRFRTCRLDAVLFIQRSFKNLGSLRGLYIFPLNSDCYHAVLFGSYSNHCLAIDDSRPLRRKLNGKFQNRMKQLASA